MVTNEVMELIPGLPNDVATECLVRVPFDKISKAASVCKDWRIRIQQAEFWRRRKAAGFTQPLIAMAQARPDPNKNGHGDAGTPRYQLTVCDPDRGFWSELPLVPELDQGLPAFCQITGVGRSLVVMGGFHPVTWKTLSWVLIYDFLTATWRRGADIPGGQRSFFGCASDSDHMVVLVAGGHDGGKNALKSAMAYDVANDEWTSLPDMARERDECKCVFNRGRFHVIGGYCTERQGRFERSAEVLDPGRCRWDQLEDFLTDARCQRNCHESLLMFLEEEEEVELIEVCNGLCLTASAWSRKLIVIGKTRSSGYVCAYVKDLVNGVLTRIQIPLQYSGHTQSSCYLEI